jgi:hypothetical protein
MATIFQLLLAVTLLNCTGSTLVMVTESVRQTDRRNFEKKAFKVSDILDYM